MFAIAVLLVFASIVLAGYAIATMVGGRAAAREAIRHRLDALTGRASRSGSIFKDERFSSIAFLDALLGRVSVTAWLVRMIRQAGMRNRVGEMVLYVPLLACVGFLLGTLLVANPLISVALAAGGGAIPIAVVLRKRGRRMRMFSEQLPDALDLVRAALQAGHSFVTALYVVADEFPDPVAEEFRTVAEEMRLGLPMRDALYHLRERTDDTNVPILVIGVLVAQEIGGNMAEVLGNVTYTIRERFKLLRDAQVMTAQGRFSGWVLTALPFGVGLFMYFLNPTYFAPMLESETGLYMMGYALISIVIGHLAIQRIVRIRV